MIQLVTPSRLSFMLLSFMMVGGVAYAQRQPNGVPPGQRGIDRPGQVGPKQGRLPGGQRGLGRGPLGDPQFGRPKDRLRTPEERRRVQQQLMQAIGITEDQRLRMDAIRRDHEDEIISAGRRLREARRGFDRAIMSEQYDEALINRHVEELAAAQADVIRLQARIRGQVRGVLSPEQVMRFNELERRLRRQQRGQKEMEKEMGPRGQNSPLPRGSAEIPQPDLISLLLNLP